MRSAAERAAGPGGEPRVYAVGELTRLIRAALEGEFGDLWVEGEVSNFRQPSSGHWYFTLKDEGAQIGAVMFRGDQASVRFRLADGLLVRLYGRITVYERGGVYQVVARRIEQSGKGALQAAFEALKKKLLAEGLFDAARKRPIPMMPQHVGIVTSPTGAAIRDILNVVTRRFPNLHIVLAPARVQGEGAAGEIAAAIDLLNRRGGIDVMIVGRGGGSLEDLWCFNEEAVARAIHRSRIPVISAVGHEVDFTISDFVADLRAPTPSAAAELVVGRKDEFEERVGALAGRMARSLRAAVLLRRHRLAAAARSYVFREPADLVRRGRERVDGLALRMLAETRSRVRGVQQRLDETDLRMAHRVRAGARELRLEVNRLSGQLRVLSPLSVLDRGYSITRKMNGEVVAAASAVAPGECVRTMTARGSFQSEVRSIDERKETE